MQGFIKEPILTIDWATSAVLACSPAGRLQEETAKTAPRQKRRARVSWNAAAQATLPGQ